ncbi:MAG: NAD(P)/FAD-dependent oxidoreductase [Actinomycetota bacterium]
MTGIEVGEARGATALGAAAVGAVSGGVAGGLLAVLRAIDGLGDGALLPVANRPLESVLHLVAAVGLGAAVGVLFRNGGGGAASTSGGLLAGLLWWMLGPLTLSPLLDGRGPTWSLADASAVFPSLVTALLVGGLGGALFAAVGPQVGRLPWLSRLVAPAVRSEPSRVVVLGGGFGGVATAQRLERRMLAGADLAVSLVSPSNSLLFTPMLAEVAGSALQPHHISAPIRATCPRTRFYRGEVTGIDVDRRLVHIEGTSAPLPYDHLVVALGSVPNYRDLPGLAEHSFTLKSLPDAVAIRNHVIAMLERADAETDATERRRQLTFVVAGGGFAGTETIAELFDLVHNARRYYPHIDPAELRFVLVHSGDRLLPEIGPELADFALQRLRRRGIEFLLGTRVGGASTEAMHLADGERIPTRTLVWTAGNQPHPALGRLPAERNRAGALVVDETLRSTTHPEVWAVGDCAQIPDPLTGGLHPPTAQHALREGKTLGDNIAAAVEGRPPKPFRFTPIGILVALGHRTAVAEIRGLRFSGLAAWVLWRGVYLSKLPGLEKKLRVLIDWTIDLLFPRDIVLAADPDERRIPEPAAPTAPMPPIAPGGRP